MGTRLLMDSTPAPMATSMAPAITAWAARKWMACWAEAALAVDRRARD